MSVIELIQIIKDEKLYEYQSFQVGEPNSPDAIGTFINGADVIGICSKDDNNWKQYSISERGQVHYMQGEQTEDEACCMLLDFLRAKKQYAMSIRSPKSTYGVLNRDIWFT